MSPHAAGGGGALGGPSLRSPASIGPASAAPASTGWCPPGKSGEPPLCDPPPLPFGSHAAHTRPKTSTLDVLASGVGALPRAAECTRCARSLSVEHSAGIARTTRPACAAHARRLASIEAHDAGYTERLRSDRSSSRATPLCLRREWHFTTCRKRHARRKRANSRERPRAASRAAHRGPGPWLQSIAK